MTNKNQKYLKTFFQEKNLREQFWELQGKSGINFISNNIVIEHILVSPDHEQAQIIDVLRKIDFANGDVNDFLKHLAHALVA